MTATLLNQPRRPMPTNRNAAVDALRPQIEAVLAERPRTFAGRWFPDATHGTTPVATFDRAAMDVLTLADVFGMADDIRASGAEPRLAFVFDAEQRVTGVVIGARVPDAALATERSDADDLLARYRYADGWLDAGSAATTAEMDGAA